MCVRHRHNCLNLYAWTRYMYAGAIVRALQHAYVDGRMLPLTCMSQYSSPRLQATRRPCMSVCVCPLVRACAAVSSRPCACVDACFVALEQVC